MIPILTGCILIVIIIAIYKSKDHKRKSAKVAEAMASMAIMDANAKRSRLNSVESMSNLQEQYNGNMKIATTMGAGMDLQRVGDTKDESDDTGEADIVDGEDMIYSVDGDDRTLGNEVEEHGVTVRDDGVELRNDEFIIGHDERNDNMHTSGDMQSVELNDGEFVVDTGF